MGSKAAALLCVLLCAGMASSARRDCCIETWRFLHNMFKLAVGYEYRSLDLCAFVCATIRWHRQLGCIIDCCSPRKNITDKRLDVLKGSMTPEFFLKFVHKPKLSGGNGKCSLYFIVASPALADSPQVLRWRVTTPPRAASPRSETSTPTSSVSASISLLWSGCPERAGLCGLPMILPRCRGLMLYVDSLIGVDKSTTQQPAGLTVTFAGEFHQVWNGKMSAIGREASISRTAIWFEVESRLWESTAMPHQQVPGRRPSW